VRVVSASGVEVRGTNGSVKIRTDVHRNGIGRGNGTWTRDVQVTVPHDMAIDAQGTSLSADLDGVGGEVRLSTNNGDLRVRGGREFIRMHTVQGDVVLEGADGRVDLHSTNGSVTASGVRGEVGASTVNGSIILRDMQSTSVEASTVNGAVEYAGTIERGGRYQLEAHAGDVTVTIPETAGVTLSASTFSGSFETTFPVTLQKAEGGGRTLSLSLGDGGAQMELASFSGTIRLRRP
jgi:DUF4097 and DUF4098 domain-containing protein YvlB